MQVILMEKVANLGDLGAVVRVKDGYARNFLIPQKMARRATAQAIAEFEAKRAELEKIAAAKLALAKTQGEKMSGLTIGRHDDIVGGLKEVCQNITSFKVVPNPDLVLLVPNNKLTNGGRKTTVTPDLTVVIGGITFYIDVTFREPSCPTSRGKLPEEYLKEG